MTARLAHSAAAVLPLALAGSVAAAAAQQQPVPRLQPLARIDVIGARQTAFQGALGVVVPLGSYVRVDAVTGAGVTAGVVTTGASGRVDLVARFLLDPLGEHRLGPYAGGGASLRYDPVVHWRPFIALVAGVDGPARGHAIVPFAEVGFGGGVRIGIGVRRYTPPFR